MTTNDSLPSDDDSVDPQAIEMAAEFADDQMTNLAEKLIIWDEAPSTTGTSAPKVMPEDEIPIAEQLIEEGVDEADREQRLAAEEPDFEP